MFGELRNRMVKSLGVRTLSLDDLEKCDVDSLDSICISETNSLSSSTFSSSLGFDKQEILEHVNKMFKTIANLSKQSNQLEMIRFIEIIRDQYYPDVSMNMFYTFIQQCKMSPRNNYMNWLIYFIHYAEFYHIVRTKADIIDNDKRENHLLQMSKIRAQLKIIYKLIHRQRERSGISNHSTSVSL